MIRRTLFRKKENRPVTAVQMDLEFDTFQYQKWGGNRIAAAATG